MGGIFYFNSERLERMTEMVLHVSIVIMWVLSLQFVHYALKHLQLAWGVR